MTVAAKASFVAFLIVCAFSLESAEAQSPRPAQTEERRQMREAADKQAPSRTGKERLGEKWRDEQRVDNCRVPLEQRGVKPRPDCVDAAAE